VPSILVVDDTSTWTTRRPIRTWSGWPPTASAATPVAPSVGRIPADATVCSSPRSRRPSVA